jgi:FKBP-type peptidyl-prolyl cis-trans isomerase FkpA
MKYKNLRFSIYFVLTISMVLPVSCIKDNNQEEENEKKLIESYVQNNAGFEAQASGMYYAKLTEGTGATPTASDLVIINYKAWKLESLKLFDTSDLNEAALNSLTGATLSATEGPLKIALIGSYGFYSIGVSEALLKMKEGGIAKIIVPGSLALGNYTPLLFQVELLKVITNPKQFEKDQISHYLSELDNGLTLADSTGAHSNSTSDTTGLWLYNKTAGTGNFPVEGDSVTISYSVKLLPYYESPHLDVPERTLVSNSTMKIKLGYTSLISGIQGAVKLTKDQGRATVIIPNNKAYGSEVMTNSTTYQLIIPQYSTLIVDINITKVKKNS